MCLFFPAITIFPHYYKKEKNGQTRQHLIADQLNFVPAATTLPPCHPAITSLVLIWSVRTFCSDGCHSIQTGAECSQSSALAFHFTSSNSSIATLTFDVTIYNVENHCAGTGGHHAPDGRRINTNFGQVAENKKK